MKLNQKRIRAFYWSILLLYACTLLLFLLGQPYWWNVGIPALGISLLILMEKRSHSQSEQKFRRRFGIKETAKDTGIAALSHLSKTSLQQLDDIVQIELQRAWLGKRRRRRFVQLATDIDELLLLYKQQEINAQTLERMRVSVMTEHFLLMAKKIDEVYRTNDSNVYAVIADFVRYQVEFEGTAIKVCMPIIKTI